MLTDILIALGCLITLFGGVIVLAASNPTRSLLGLFIASLALGFLYLLLGGSFVSMAQIIVYAGAVLMLFLFVVRYFVRKLPRSRITFQVPLSVLAVIILLLQIIVPLISWFWILQFNPDFVPPDPSTFGKHLFEKYVYAFELVTVLLLVSIVGAIYMARGEMKPVEEDNK